MYTLFCNRLWITPSKSGHKHKQNIRQSMFNFIIEFYVETNFTKDSSIRLSICITRNVFVLRLPSKQHLHTFLSTHHAPQERNRGCNNIFSSGKQAVWINLLLKKIIEYDFCPHIGNIALQYLTRSNHFSKLTSATGFFVNW